MGDTERPLCDNDVLNTQLVDQCEESCCNQREQQLEPDQCFGAIFCDSTKKWIGGVVIASALGGISWGFYLSVIAGAMLFVDDYFSLSALWHEIVVSVTIAGAAVGAVTAGALNDKLGRRKVIMISAILYGVGGAVMAAAFSQVFLVIGRTLVGLGMGLFSTTGSVYVSEMSPSHLRGKLGVVVNSFTAGGQLTGVVIAGLFSVDSNFAYAHGWRLMLGFGILPSIGLLLVMCFLVETPRWLVFHGKTEKAREVLRKLRHHKLVENELSSIVTEHEKSQKDRMGTVEFIKRAIRSKTLIHALCVGIGVHVYSALSGPTVMATYYATILRMAGFNIKQAIWFSTLPILANITMKFIASMIVERIGRRKLLIVSAVGTSFCLFLLATSFYMETVASSSAVQGGGMCDFDKCGSCVANSHCGFCALHIDGEYINGSCLRGSRDHANMMINGTKCITWDTTDTFNTSDTEWHFDYCPDSKYVILSLVTIFMYAAFVSVGLGPLAWVINSEIYPMWARGKAVAVASMFNWTATLLSAVTFLTLIDAIGQPKVLIMYGAITLAGALFITLLLPETSRKQLEDIEILFSKLHFLRWRKPFGNCKKYEVKYTELELQKQEDVAS